MSIDGLPCRCLLSMSDVHNFIQSCMIAVGTKPNHAKDLADVLVDGDNKGHLSHGLNRLDMYVNDIKSGICAKEGEPVISKSTVATTLVDGKNLLGPVVGNFCMKLAISKAKDVGIGWVVAHGSNHFGVASYYSMQALNHKFIGMSYTNTSPLVVATRAKECTLGTNPISVAAPAKDKNNFVLDMATSAVALGKVELQHRRGEKMPLGWGSNAEGKASNDPAEILNGGGLLPIGGLETTGGYKGYGLAMMVEVFCGILSGSHYSKHIRAWKSQTGQIADLGQCFVAIDPGCFASGFEERMADLLNIHRNLEPSVPGQAVLTAGDPEREHMAKCSKYGGIPYPINVINFMVSLQQYQFTFL
uniref:Uncharacterized LOC103186039 n=1 Tax=Callorhinchus milii TaxID=7868 RepID=A0A4W3HN10_CALMI